MWLPEELSASIGVGATLGAMMGDQSLSEARGKGCSQCGSANAVRSIFLVNQRSWP